MQGVSGEGRRGGGGEVERRERPCEREAIGVAEERMAEEMGVGIQMAPPAMPTTLCAPSAFAISAT